MSEYNFYADAEAARLVLHAFAPHCPTTLVTWEFCLDHITPWQFIEDSWVGRERNVRERFAHQVLQPLIRLCRGRRPGIAIADAYAAACVLDPACVLEAREGCQVDVVTHEGLTRGMLAYNERDRKAPGFVGPVRVCTRMDMSRYERLLLASVEM